MSELGLLELYNQIRKDAVIEKFEFDGRQYTSQRLVELHEPTVEMLNNSTLTGLVDYLTSNIDGYGMDEIFCHVQSPTKVTIRSTIIGQFKQREAIIMAEPNFTHFKFGEWYDTERFIIAAQSSFKSNESRDLILKYVGNMKAENIKTVGDDGISQQITTKTGVATVGNVVLPNPVALRPYRTFNEVEQPESKFVFRGKDGNGEIYFALFEADNAAWRGEAMRNIKEYMETHVPGLHVIA